VKIFAPRFLVRDECGSPFLLLLASHSPTLGGVLEKELRVLPLLISEGKPEVKAFVFRIWTLTLRGEMLRKVGVGPGYTQLARDPGRCLSMSLDSARAGKTLYRAGGFS